MLKFKKNHLIAVIVVLAAFIVYSAIAIFGESLTELQMDQPMEIEGVNVEFKSLSFSNSIANYYSGETTVSTANPGYKYALVEFTATNNSDIPQNFSLPHSGLNESAGAELSGSSSSVKSSSNYIPEQIKPGETEAGYFSFLILENSYPTRLNLTKAEAFTIGGNKRYTLQLPEPQTPSASQIASESEINFAYKRNWDDLDASWEQVRKNMHEIDSLATKTISEESIRLAEPENLRNNFFQAADAHKAKLESFRSFVTANAIVLNKFHVPTQRVRADLSSSLDDVDSKIFTVNKALAGINN